MLGCLFCLDYFLTLFMLAPLRCLMVLIRWKSCSNKRQDLLKGILVLVSCWILYFVNPSKLYHLVRGQSIFKLYVIYNVIEVSDLRN
jgi:hypothetical protein